MAAKKHTAEDTAETLASENRRLREALKRILSTAGAGALDCADDDVAVATFGLVQAHATRAIGE